MSYDPQADLVYFGTGNGGPWPEVLRGSKGQDNQFVCSILAVKGETGEFRWAYQVVPTDSWDFDSVQQLTLADITINGRLRRVIMQANKDGFFYVLDRLTGEFISADAYAPLNWASGIDPKTGRPIIRKEAYYDAIQPVTIYPGPIGAHNWSPMSFNPISGLVYIPSSQNSSRTYTVNAEFVYREGGRNTGAGGGGGQAGAAGATPTPARQPIVPPMIGPPLTPEGRGVLVAWDPVTQKERWRTVGGGSTGGGTVTTAGNLVFQVIGDGRLVAYSADKGEKLHEIQTNQRIGMGPPITYMVDGRQYVALMGGRGGGAAPAAGAPGRGAPPPPPAPPAPPAPPSGRGESQPAAAPPASPPQIMTYSLDGK
jgi:quinohemoprotein ethanol dehydrogenase